MSLIGIHHVQLAIPRGAEDQARAFYDGVLGIPEVAKPAEMAARGGCWFERGDLRLHVGVEDDFRPAKKAHPAVLVDDWDAMLARLAAAAIELRESNPIAGARRGFVDDPFGNRVELFEASQRLGFAVIYRWRLDEARLADFIEAWAEMTLHIRANWGGMGSRLHRNPADDTWWAYAQWPSRAQWAAPRDPLTLRADLSQRMRAAMLEELEPIELDPQVDLLLAAEGVVKGEC